MSNTNTTLIPYPQQEVVSVVSEESAINVSSTLLKQRKGSINGKYTGQELVQFGAYVFSQAYSQAASEMFTYVNNHVSAFMQKSNETFAQALEVLRMYGTMVEQGFNQGINTMVSAQAQQINSIRDVLVSTYNAQAQTIIDTKDQIINTLQSQNENLQVELRSSREEINRLNNKINTDVSGAKDEIIGLYKQQLGVYENAGYTRGKLESTELRAIEQSEMIKSLQSRVQMLEGEISTVRMEKDTRVREVEGQLEQSKKEYGILYQQAVAFRESAQGTLDEANKMYRNKKTEVDRLKKKLGELEAQQKSMEEKYKKDIEEKSTTESSVGDIKLKINNENYVHIDKEIIKNPAVVMKKEFFEKYKYFGFIYPMGIRRILSYYNDENKMVTKFTTGLIFDGAEPSAKVIEDADLVMFENRKIE